MARFGFGFGINSIQGQFAPVIGTKQNFTTFVAAGNKHLTMGAITLTGAFVIEYDATYGGAATQITLGDSLSSADFLGSLSSGAVRLQINSVNVSTGTARLDAKLRHVKVERDGSNNITVTVKGFTPENLGTLAGDFTTDLIGKAGFGNPWDGVIANVSITDVADRKRFYKIDETWDGPSTVVVDYGSDGLNGTAVNITSADSEPFTRSGVDWLGVELITQAVWENPNIVGGEWAFANNQWTLTGSGASSVLRLLSTTNQPDNMKLAGNCVSVTGTLRATDGSIGADITTAGLYDFIFTKADALNQQYKRASGSVNATIDKPSLKRILEGI